MARGQKQMQQEPVKAQGPSPVLGATFDPIDESNNFNTDRAAYASPSQAVKAVSFNDHYGHQNIQEGAGEARPMFPTGKE